MLEKYARRRTIVATAVCVLAGLLVAPAALAETGSFAQVPGSPFATGKSPQQVVFSPSGRLLATANSGDNTLSVFSVDPSSGRLTQAPGSPYAVSGGGYSVAFGPAGNLLAAIACTSADHGDCLQQAVAVFSVSALTGALAQVPGSPFALGDAGAQALAFSPSEDLLAIANYGNQYPPVGSVSVFSVDPSTGQPADLQRA